MSKIVIDDAMVERAHAACIERMGHIGCWLKHGVRAALEAALSSPRPERQRRYTDTPREERRRGEGARLMPRTCLEYGPIEMPDGTFQHRRRSDGENGLRDVVHNRSDDRRIGAAKPRTAEIKYCPECQSLHSKDDPK